MSMVAQGKIDQKKLVVVYRSQSFPTTGYGYPYNLNPTLARKIENAFFSFRLKDSEGAPMDLDKYHDALFIPAQYRKNWKLVRAIDHANQPTHECQ
jgi:phosphonate transport system substrate-binding protein